MTDHPISRLATFLRIRDNCVSESTVDPDQQARIVTGLVVYAQRQQLTVEVSAHCQRVRDHVDAVHRYLGDVPSRTNERREAA